MKVRKIIHIDMDAFYASVEQRDNRQLKGKPVIVGGLPNSRGVVCACSYEARKFGIHSAMPSAEAYRRCPGAVFLTPRFGKYKEVSGKIRDIFYEYTDLVEPLSLDEAYLDVTENFKNISSATVIAFEIRKKIYRETGLTASAGVSYNKFLAKVASDYNKPDGITVITPEQAEEFIKKLPIGKFFGIGKVTEKKFMQRGIRTGADLIKVEKEELVSQFGKAGEFYYYIVRGIDNRPVDPEHIRKSLGKEITLQKDIDDINAMIDLLKKISGNIIELAKRYDILAKTITLKVKYHNFKVVTRRITLAEPVVSEEIVMTHVKRLLAKTGAGREKVRLLGISLSNFTDNNGADSGSRQLTLPFEI